MGSCFCLSYMWSEDQVYMTTSKPNDIHIIGSSCWPAKSISSSFSKFLYYLEGEQFQLHLLFTYLLFQLHFPIDLLSFFFFIKIVFLHYFFILSSIFLYSFFNLSLSFLYLFSTTKFFKFLTAIFLNFQWQHSQIFQ